MIGHRVPLGTYLLTDRHPNLMTDNKSQFRFNLPRALHQQAMTTARTRHQNLTALLRAYLEAYVSSQPQNNASKAA